MRPIGLRVAIGVLLVVAAVLLGLMLWIPSWERIEQAGRVAYFVPPWSTGSRVLPEILPRLGQIGGGALGFALALAIVERLLVRRLKREAETGVVREKPTTGRVIIQTAITIIIAIVVTCGWRWHSYVTNTKSPYEEIGIELNSRMPGPINAWGCAQLKATFGERMIPPYGCAAPDGKWL